MVWQWAFPRRRYRRAIGELAVVRTGCVIIRDIATRGASIFALLAPNWEAVQRQ